MEIDKLIKLTLFGVIAGILVPMGIGTLAAYTNTANTNLESLISEVLPLVMIIVIIMGVVAMIYVKARGRKS